MKIFQKMYDFFKKLNIPEWAKPWVQAMNDVMIDIAKKSGKAFLNYLIQEAIKASKMNISSEDKFKYVFNAARKSIIPALVELKDSELNFFIESIVADLKKKKVID